MVDMSRYLHNIRDELDKWLASNPVKKDKQEAAQEEVACERLRPEVPSSLPLGSWTTVERSRWLTPSGSLSRSSSLTSCSSFASTSSAPAHSTSYNKWLLHGGSASGQGASGDCPPCPFMEKIITESKSLVWIKKDIPKSTHAPKSSNPLENFVSSSFEPSQWLKPAASNSMKQSAASSPLDKFISMQKSSPMSMWLYSTSGLNKGCSDFTS